MKLLTSLLTEADRLDMSSRVLSDPEKLREAMRQSSSNLRQIHDRLFDAHDELRRAIRALERTDIKMDGAL